MMAPNNVTVVDDEEVPCFTNSYDSSWFDDDDSICLEEYSDDNDEEGHALYLQRDGLDFKIPIVFEDGMDFEESQLYYASIESQLTGGALRGLQKKQQRRPTTRDITGPLNNKSLHSCLRKPRTKKIKSIEPTLRRRCSFGGHQNRGHLRQQTLVRSLSMRCHGDDEPRRLCFEEYVQVNSIPSVDDYPPAIRSQLWMSRQEMMTAMRCAMIEGVQKPLLEEEEELDYASQEQPKDDEVARQNSMNDVITECIQTVTICR